MLVGILAQALHFSWTMFQEARRIFVVNPAQNVGRQVDAAQPELLGLSGLRLVIRVGDGARALPGTFPERALTPVAADVMLALQMMARNQVRSEEETARVPA